MEDIRKKLTLNLKFNPERCEVCDWCGKEKKSRKFVDISGGPESIYFKKERIEKKRFFFYL